MEEKFLKFSPRPYQKPAYDAIMKDGFKRLLYIAPRRSGKDVLAWSLAIMHCLERTCMSFYCLPNYKQAKKCIWDAIMNNGVTFLDFVPKEAIHSINQSELKIVFKNHSILQLVGADSFETALVGTNVSFVVFSEFAKCDSRCWDFSRQIIAANGGKALFVSTPRGHNHCYDLYNKAVKNKKWKVILQTCDDTHHIPQDVLEEERRDMSEDLFLQEYYCSFDRGLEGSIYGKFIDKMNLNGQIGDSPWDPSGLVYLAFDIGLTAGNSTCIIWYQVSSNGLAVYVIDCFSGTDLGLDSYVKIIREKPYRYGGMFAPWDMAQREWGGGAVTRYERARQMGLELQVLKQAPVQDGIDLVYTTMPRVWIDQTKCRSLVSALENYQRTWDEAHQVYSNKPVHNWASNYADAFRYLCQSLEFAKQGMSSEDFDRAKNQALYGNNRNQNQWDKWIR